MRLERIILKSFGCFDRRDFDLSDGVNLIFGPNFSGKSTLVNAIFFTLTGKPIVPKVGLPAMAQSGAASGTAGLIFHNGEQNYQLFRSTQGEVQLRLKEEQGDKWRVLFTGKRSADEDLRKKFHFSYHQLAAATFLREGEIFEFLARQPADRRDVLHALLGIDRLMDVRQRFIDGRRIAKREEKRIERVEAELKHLESQYESLSDSGTETGDTALIAELRQAHERFQKEIDGLIQERASTLRGFTDVNHLRTSIKEIEAATASAGGLDKQRDKLIQGVGSLNSQVQTLTAECETLRQLIDSDHGHCPTCHQPVQQKVIAGILKEKESARATSQKELDAQQKALDEQTANINALRGLRQRHQLMQGKVEQLEQIEKRLTKLQREFDGVASRLGALQPPPAPQTGVRSDAAADPVQVAEQRRQLKYRIDSLRRRLVGLNKEEAVLAHKLQELQRTQGQADQILRTRLSFELACEGIDKTIASLQHTILQPAEKEIQRWLERMDLTRFSQIDLKSQHLLPSLNVEGVERNLLLLSGSEKMMLYLCFKAALSEALGALGFFVFDDPTLHLDPDRRGAMIDFIQQLAEEHQVIVTSNDPEVRAGLPDAHLIETVPENGSS